MKLSRIIFAAAFSMIAAEAVAADINKARRAVDNQATVMPRSWSGCHVGGLVGYVRKDNGFNVSGGDATTNYVLAQNWFPSSVPIGVDGLSVGVGVGCDWQIMQYLVIGAQYDYNWLNVSGSAYAGGNLIGVTATESMKNMHTLRANIGVPVFTNTMPYFTIGWAWARFDTAISSSGLACGPSSSISCPSGSVSETADGLVLGGGVRHRFGDGWSIKVEYLHIDFDVGSTPATGSYTTGWGKNQKTHNYALNYTQDRKVDTIRVGLDYKFFTP